MYVSTSPVCSSRYGMQDFHVVVCYQVIYRSLVISLVQYWTKANKSLNRKLKIKLESIGEPMQLFCASLLTLITVTTYSRYVSARVWGTHCLTQRIRSYSVNLLVQIVLAWMLNSMVDETRTIRERNERSYHEKMGSAVYVSEGCTMKLKEIEVPT